MTGWESIFALVTQGIDLDFLIRRFMWEWIGNAGNQSILLALNASLSKHIEEKRSKIGANRRSDFVSDGALWFRVPTFNHEVGAATWVLKWLAPRQHPGDERHHEVFF